MTEANLELHAEVLAALGHPLRLAILRFVVQAGIDWTSAGKIQAHVGVPASTLSHHLRRLVDTGLLQTLPEGTFYYYQADHRPLRALIAYLRDDCCKQVEER